MNEAWIWAAGAIIIGLLSGVVGAALVRRIILRGRSERAEMHDAARASSTFIFLFFTVMGVIVALNFTDREALEPVPSDVLGYSPHVLAAGLILIAGRALAYAFGGLVGASLEGSPGRVRTQLVSVVRFVIVAASIVLALAQLGVDTTVLVVITAAVMFGLALAFALLVGLGGREVSSELATGRYLQRLVRVDDEIEFGGRRGTVVALHPASIEMIDGSGRRVHVPNRVVFAEEFVIDR